MPAGKDLRGADIEIEDDLGEPTAQNRSSEAVEEQVSSAGADETACKREYEGLRDGSNEGREEAKSCRTPASPGLLGPLQSSRSRP